MLAVTLGCCAATAEGCIQTVPLGTEMSFFALEKSMAVYCIPVGAQDCYLITCDGEAMVVDCAATGREPTPDFLLQLIRGLGITKLKYAVNTHPHRDHMEGFDELMAAVPTDEFITCFPPKYDKYQKRLLKRVAELNVPVRQYTEGEPLPLGSAEITTYRYHKSKNTNDISLVMHLRYGERSIMLTADIGLTAQRKMAKEYGDQWRSDILKIPHHCIGTVSKDMLNIVAPELCFFSNAIGKTTKRGRELMDKKGIPYYATARQCLAMITDGTVWQVQQWEDDAIRVPGLTLLPAVDGE